MKIQDIDLYEVLSPDFRWTHEGCLIWHCKLHKDRYLSFHFPKQSVCVGLPKSFSVAKIWPSATAFCESLFGDCKVNEAFASVPLAWCKAQARQVDSPSCGFGFACSRPWEQILRSWTQLAQIVQLIMLRVLLKTRHKSPWFEIPKCLILLEAIRFNDIGQTFRIRISVGRSDVLFQAKWACAHGSSQRRGAKVNGGAMALGHPLGGVFFLTVWTLLLWGFSMQPRFVRLSRPLCLMLSLFVFLWALWVCRFLHLCLFCVASLIDFCGFVHLFGPLGLCLFFSSYLSPSMAAFSSVLFLCHPLSCRFGDCFRLLGALWLPFVSVLTFAFSLLISRPTGFLAFACLFFAGYDGVAMSWNVHQVLSFELWLQVLAPSFWQHCFMSSSDSRSYLPIIPQESYLWVFPLGCEESSQRYVGACNLRWPIEEIFSTLFSTLCSLGKLILFRPTSHRFCFARSATAYWPFARVVAPQMPPLHLGNQN